MVRLARPHHLSPCGRRPRSYRRVKVARHSGCRWRGSTRSRGSPCSAAR
jgi:hypothetical protein